MTYRVRSAFGRFLALSVAAVIAWFVAVAPATARQTTEGQRYGDGSSGVPLAMPSVRRRDLVCAVTNDKNYFFINNVPVGSYTIRAQFIGYAPSEQRRPACSAGRRSR
jgi:hypothetical protein